MMRLFHSWPRCHYGAFIILLGLSLWGVEAAQAAALIGDQAEADPGTAGVDYDFSLEVVTGERVSALQFELVLSGALVLERLEAGPVAVAANKSVSINELGSGRFRVIVAGLNQNEIASGRLLEGQLTVGLDAPGGAHEVGIERLVISSPTGASVVADAQPGAVFVDRPEPTPPEQCGCAARPAVGGSVATNWGDGILIGALICLLALGCRRTHAQL